jgi:dihydrofolate reductase
MTKVIVGMTMSLDGFVNDRHGSVAALYPDLESLRHMEPLREAIQNTAAVVMGWQAYTMAEDPDWYAGNYEFQVPIFVLTHTVPRKRPKQTDTLTFTFVTDGIERAIAQAKAAAGAKDVTVIGGAHTVQQCLQAGLADELHMDIMPVLLGGGLRLFEATSSGPIRLERLQVLALPGGHDNKTARTVAVRQGETIDRPALTAMFTQIIANNRAGGWRKVKRES